MARGFGRHAVQFHNACVRRGKAQTADLVKADNVAQFPGQNVNGFPGQPGKQRFRRVGRHLKEKLRRSARRRACQRVAFHQ